MFIAAIFHKNMNHSDLAILLAFILPGFLVGFLMIFYSQQYRIRMVFDDDKKILWKIKKGAQPKEFNINDFKMIISKKIKTIPGCKYYLKIENDPEHSTNIFEEDTPYGAQHWEAFAEKLAKIINLPLKKEYYFEQFDGPLLLKTPEENISSRRRNLIMLLTPVIISFTGALIFKIYGTLRALIYIGCVTLAINMLFSFIYAFKYRDEIGNLSKNNFVLTIYILTLIIPYTLLYLFSIHFLYGFRWPIK